MTTEDTAMYCWERDTLRALLCEPRHKTSGGAYNQEGTISREQTKEIKFGTDMKKKTGDFSLVYFFHIV